MRHTEKNYTGKHARSTSMNPIETIVSSIDFSQLWKTKIVFATVCAVTAGGLVASHVQDDSITVRQVRPQVTVDRTITGTVSRSFDRTPLGTVKPTAPSISAGTGDGKWSLSEDADEMKANLEAQAADWDAARTELEALKSKINDASQKKQDDWTVNSWSVFQTALDTANKTAAISLDKGNATVYKNATVGLQTAMDGLVKKPVSSGITGNSDNNAGSLGTTVPTGEMQSWFHDYLISNGYSEDDFTAGVWIINHESGWNVHATNKSSGAFGLAQALPGSKMISAGADWHDNYQTQLKWFVSYCNGRYGGILQAYNWWRQHHWY